MEGFIAWLRRHRIGAKVKMRDFLMRQVRTMGVVPMSATLGIRVLRKDGAVEDMGIVSTREVTDDFVEQLVDTLQSSVAAFSTYKYHDSGTGTTAEDPTDTGLETACGEARTVGTQTEGAAANIYKSVATHTYANTFTITEHILANAAVDGVTMDRSVFSGIAVSNADRIEFTYELICTAGG